MKSVKTRLAELEMIHPNVRPEVCNGVPTAFVWNDDQIPPDSPRCEKCGEIHSVRFVEVMVNRGERA